MGNVILYGQYVLDSRPGPLATDSYVVFLQQSGRYPNHAGMVPGPNPVCGNVRHRIFHPVRRFSSDSYCPDAACPVLISMDFMEGLTRNSCASSASRLEPHQEDPDAGLENIQGVPFDAAYGVQADIEADSDGFAQHHVQPATVV